MDSRASGDRRGRVAKSAILDGADHERDEPLLARFPNISESDSDEDEESPPAPAGVPMAARIRERLAATKGVDSSRIRVEFERGVVILSGYSATDAMRQRIADVVSAATGVTVIRNRNRNRNLISSP